MFKVSVGMSDGEDAYSVGVTAAQDAIQTLGVAPSLVLVFSSVKYDQKKMLEGVRSVSKEALLVGASTAGEITSMGPSRKNSVVVTAIASDTVHFAVGVKDGFKADPAGAGRAAAKEVKDALGDRLVLVNMFADGLSGNGSAAVRGMLDVLGAHFPVVGGSAGDDANYKQTYQYVNGTVYSDSVVALGIGGDVTFSVGVNHGWLPIGVPQKVTKADGAILKEINGKPAFSLYEDYFGPEEAKHLSEGPLADIALSYPLGFQQEGNEELLLRAPFFANKDGSIVCGGEVPEGAEVRLMVGNKEDAVVAARKGAERAAKELGKPANIALVFSCHVRDKLFATREQGKVEIDAIQEAIGKTVPIAGFYTYAEQAPVGGETRNIEKCNPALHNETVVVILLAEK